MRKKALIATIIVIALVIAVAVAVATNRQLHPKNPAAQSAADMLQALPQHRWANLSAAARSDFPFLKNQHLQRSAALKPDVDSFDASYRDTSAHRYWDAAMAYVYSNDGKVFTTGYVALLKRENGSWKFYGYADDFNPRNMNAREVTPVRPGGAGMHLTPAEQLQYRLYQVQVVRSATNIKNTSIQGVAKRFLPTPYADAIDTVLPEGIRFTTDVTTYKTIDELDRLSIDTRVKYPAGGTITYRVIIDRVSGEMLDAVPLKRQGIDTLHPRALFATDAQNFPHYTTAVKVYENTRDLAAHNLSYRTRFYADLITKADADTTHALSPDQQQQIEQWRKELADDPLTATDMYPVPLSWQQTDATHGTIWTWVRSRASDKTVPLGTQRAMNFDMVLDDDNVWRIKSVNNG